jgi:hypothetical protein
MPTALDAPVASTETTSCRSSSQYVAAHFGSRAVDRFGLEPVREQLEDEGVRVDTVNAVSLGEHLSDP